MPLYLEHKNSLTAFQPSVGQKLLSSESPEVFPQKVFSFAMFFKELLLKRSISFEKNSGMQQGSADLLLL